MLKLAFLVLIGIFWSFKSAEAIDCYTCSSALSTEQDCAGDSYTKTSNIVTCASANASCITFESKLASDSCNLKKF